MSEIDLSGMSRAFLFEIYHRNPGATPVWFRVVNAKDYDEARRIALALFVGAGLSVLLIDNIEWTEVGGGGNGG